MDERLREMESLHRQLLHYGKRVTDDDYAETLLGHVARTHRDVVRPLSITWLDVMVEQTDLYRRLPK